MIHELVSATLVRLVMLLHDNENVAVVKAVGARSMADRIVGYWAAGRFPNSHSMPSISICYGDTKVDEMWG
jgi:hypothetical protein